MPTALTMRTGISWTTTDVATTRTVAMVEVRPRTEMNGMGGVGGIVGVAVAFKAAEVNAEGVGGTRFVRAAGAVSMMKVGIAMSMSMTTVAHNMMKMRPQAPDHSAQRKESDSTAETSVRPAFTVSRCAKVPSTLGRPDTIDSEPAEGPVSMGEEQEAPVFVVDTLPPGGIAQLIRTYTKELNAFGAIVLRASPSLRPGDCPMPATSNLATLKQLYPMMPTTVSTGSQPKDSVGILPKVETLLPILQSEDLSIKDFNRRGAACATRLRALYPGADEAKFSEGMTDASVF